MKIRKRTETIGFRVEPEFKQEVLKFAFENEISLTDLFEKSFHFYAKSYLENVDVCQEKLDKKSE